MTGRQTRPSGPSLTSLLADRNHLLLDFDGPICRLFAGLPAPQIALSLLGRLPRRLADEARSTDPHEVLRRVHALAPELTGAVERAIADHETEAAASAAPTPHAHHLIATARRADWTVSVVTNNSPRAVVRYLDLHGIKDHIDVVAGRGPGDVQRMKPDPALVRQALEGVGAEPSAAILVGNSPSDIDAGRRAGIETIGFVDRDAKQTSLASAAALVTTLTDIVTALTPRVHRT